MSIEHLKAALAGRRDSGAVVVSSALFAELYEAAELRPRKRSWAPPADSACKKVLDAHLRVEGLPLSDNLFTLTWHLFARNDIRVVRDSDVFLRFETSGPRSFQFR